MEKSVKAVSETRTSRDIASQCPAGQRMAMNAVARQGVSIALACRAFEISETCYRYSPVLNDENEEIADWLERLTTNNRSWGFGLCFLYLRNVPGLWMEPQTSLPDLLRACAEPADQAQETAEARQAGTAGSA